MLVKMSDLSCPKFGLADLMATISERGKDLSGRYHFRDRMVLLKGIERQMIAEVLKVRKAEVGNYAELVHGYIPVCEPGHGGEDLYVAPRTVQTVERLKVENRVIPISMPVATEPVPVEAGLAPAEKQVTRNPYGRCFPRVQGTKVMFQFRRFSVEFELAPVLQDAITAFRGKTQTQVSLPGQLLIGSGNSEDPYILVEVIGYKSGWFELSLEQGQQIADALAASS